MRQIEAAGAEHCAVTVGEFDGFREKRGGRDGCDGSIKE